MEIGRKKIDTSHIFSFYHSLKHFYSFILSNNLFIDSFTITVNHNHSKTNNYWYIFIKTNLIGLTQLFLVIIFKIWPHTFETRCISYTCSCPLSVHNQDTTSACGDVANPAYNLARTWMVTASCDVVWRHAPSDTSTRRHGTMMTAERSSRQSGVHC